MDYIVTQARKIRCTNNYWGDSINDICSVFWILYTIDMIEICEFYNRCDEVNTINLSDRDLLYAYPGCKFILKAGPFAQTLKETNVYIEYSPDSDLTARFSIESVDGSNQILNYQGTW